MTKVRWGIALAAMVAALPFHADAAYAAPVPAAEEPKTAPNRLLVRFVPDAERTEPIADAETKVVDRLLMARTFELRTRAGQTVDDAVTKLEAQPGVEFAEPVYRFEFLAMPDDPRYGQQWHLPAIGAPTAWDRTTGSSDVTIAVVDSGVDPNHPDLVGRLEQGFDFVEEDSNPRDDDGHGTAVLGAIGADTNNAVGVAGVDQAARMLPLRACDRWGCWSNDIIDAIVHARREGVPIVNLSLGSFGLSLGYKIAMEDSPDVLFVAGAGNDGANTDRSFASFLPCNHAEELPNVVCVAAQTRGGALAPFSNWGSGVTLAAPGVEINTTLPTYEVGRERAYGAVSGTSLSTPLVTGAAALLLAERPQSTPEELKAALAHGDPTDELTSSKPVASGAELDIPDSLEYLDDLDADVAPGAMDVPRVSGQARLRHQLSSWPGRWRGEIEETTYQWQRETLGVWLDVPGATRSTYDVTADDVGHSLRLAVTVRDAEDRSATAYSLASAPTVGDTGSVRLLHEEAWASIAGKSTTEAILESEFVGDVNGDGYEDLAVVRGEYDGYAPGTSVVLGPISPEIDLLDPPPHRTVELDSFGTTNNQTAINLAPAGDFDADGFSDLIVAEQNPERSYIVFGDRDMSDMELVSAGDRAMQVSFDRETTLPAGTPTGVGDVDGDGYDDVVFPAIGGLASRYDLSPGSQRVFVLYGGDSRADTLVADSSMQGHRSTVIRGYATFPWGSAYAAGDSNGDGYDDIAVSVPSRSLFGGDYPAALAVVYGGPDGPTDRIRPMEAGRGFTVEVSDESLITPEAVAGDVDGDGFDDIAIPWDGESGGARTRVVWGAAEPREVDLMDLGSDGFTVTGGPQGSVSTVALGDLNGDGKDEVAVGSPVVSALGRGAPGALSLLPGGHRTGTVAASPVQPPLGIELAGENNRDLAGAEIEAGDMNRDGADELVVLSRRADPQGRKDAGRLDVLSLGRGGIEPQKPPTARLDAPERVEAGPVRLDASESFDPDGSIAEFRWDLDGDGEFETAGGSSVQLPASQPGKYDVAVRVRDDEGAQSFATRRIGVSVDPYPDPEGPPEPQPPKEIPSSTWDLTEVAQGEYKTSPQVASQGLDSLVSTWWTYEPFLHGTRIRRVAGMVKAPGEDFGSPFHLEREQSGFVDMDATWAGGTVAAWWDTYRRDYRYAEIPPGQSEFDRASNLPVKTVGQDWEGMLEVDVGEGGEAAMLLRGPAPGGAAQLYSLYRPAGGRFGEPEPIGPALPMGEVRTRDLTVGPDGTVAIGLSIQKEPFVAVRNAEGWMEPVPLDGWGSSSAPRVAVDGAGNVVAANVVVPPDSHWETVGEVVVTFVSSDGEVSSKETGISGITYETICLEVSEQGEVILATTSTIPGTYDPVPIGVFGAMGDSRSQRLDPAVRVSPDGQFAALGMNSRGDATLLYTSGDEVVGRTREPLGSFSRPESVIDAGGYFTYSVSVDPYGNSLGTFRDEYQWYLSGQDLIGTSEPLIAEEPPSPPVWEGTSPPFMVSEPPPPPVDPPSEPTRPPVYPEQPPNDPGVIDREPPLVQFTGASGPRRAIHLELTASEPSLVSIRVQIGRKGPVLKTSAHIQGGVGQVHLEVNRKLARRLAGRGGAKFRLNGTATDASGNSSSIAGSVRLEAN